jgi:hypothetical protein
MKYIIRYNVEHKKGLSDRKWKVYSEDGKETYLVDSVRIHSFSHSEDTPTSEGEKYSIVVEGDVYQTGEYEITILGQVMPSNDLAYLKAELQRMIVSSTQLVNSAGDVVGYQVRTGCLHRLVGMLGLYIPEGLPEKNESP